MGYRFKISNIGNGKITLRKVDNQAYLFDNNMISVGNEHFIETKAECADDDLSCQFIVEDFNTRQRLDGCQGENCSKVPNSERINKSRVNVSGGLV